jgi:hypothetical protein
VIFDMLGRSLEGISQEAVPCAGGATRLWFPGQELQQIVDPRLFGTHFPDGTLLHPRAVRRISEQAALLPPTAYGWGGKKVRDHETWNLPEMQLLMQRALLAVCAARGASSAHVVDRWANVVEPGEFSKPHSHYDAETAVVYYLDPGGEGEGKPAGGEFEIIDSRIPFCCPNGPERPTRGILPDLVPGILLVFPAPFLHYVRPYYGRRPRITLAWNISVGPPPPGLRDPAEPVAGIVNRMG